MKTFDEWFYQTEANEPDKAVLLFDRDCKNAIALLEVWLRMSYEAASNLPQPIRSALKACPDVAVGDVAKMIYARQKELEQEPDVSIYSHGMTVPTDKDYEV
jgi:hypothetical protein